MSCISSASIEERGFTTGYVSSNDMPTSHMTLAGHLGIFLAALLPAMLVVALFSVAGWGDQTYLWLTSWGYKWWVPFATSIGLAVLLWVLDSRHWKGRMLYVRHTGVALIVVGIGMGCSLATRFYPFAPLLFGMSLIPSSILLVRMSLLRSVQAWRFFASLANSLVVVAALTAGYFLLWCLALLPPPSRVRTGWDVEWKNIWGGEVKEYWRHRLGCDPENRTATINDADCYDAAFLWWVLPLVVAIALGVFAVVSRLLARVLEPSALNPDAQSVKIFIGAVAVAGSGMYVAASIAAAGMGIAEVVLAGMVAVLAVACAVVAGALGWDRFAGMVAEMPFAKFMRSDESASEWLIALLLIVGAGPLAAYLGIKFTHQLLRHWLHSNRSSSSANSSDASARAPSSSLNFSQPPDGGGWFTKGTEERLEALRHRHWGSICMKVLILGVCYLALQVLVMKVVVVALSALNQSLEQTDIYLVMLIFLAVGILMFLCPIIPGPPIYVCAGVLLPWALMDDDERAATSGPAPPSFWLGVALASALATGLKFVAIVLQQELIGARLGRSVHVRAWCSINSTFMRSARCVLEEPAPLTWGKVAILCGGPDWPTSVATGIMGLNVGMMLLGSLPIVLLVVPSCLLGAFQLMGRRPGWDVASQLATTFAAGTQMAAMLGFATVIEAATTRHAARLAAMPFDEEVRRLDREQEALVAAWRACSDWRAPGFPPRAKLVLLVGDALVVVACLLTVVTNCFERLSVADRFSEPPLSGNALNVFVAPQGWLVVVASVAATAILLAYRAWLTRRAKETVALAHAEAEDAPPPLTAAISSTASSPGGPRGVVSGGGGGGGEPLEAESGGAAGAIQ